MSNSSFDWNYIFNSISDSLILLDINGIIINCNAAFLKLVNKTGPQVIGSDCFKIVHGKTGRPKNCPFLRSKSSKNRELFTIKKDDKWFKIDVYPIIDENNEISGFVHFMSDITERRKEEKALRESEERFRTLTENINLGIYRNTVGIKGKFIEANPAIVKMFGFKNKKEFLTYNVSELYLHSEERKKFSDKMLKKGFVKDEELQLKKKDGSPFVGSISAVTIKDNKGNVKFYDGIIEDITERKQAERALRESEKKYKDLFEKSKDAILIIHNGKFVDCNQATINMLRYKNKDELLNTHPSELSPEKQPDGKMSFTKANEMMKIAFKNGSHRFEWDHKKSDGEIFPVEVLLTAISNDEKNQILHTVWRDITERKKTELALQESKNRYKYLFDQSPISIWEEDFSEVYKYLNSLKKKGIKNFRDYFEKHLDDVDKCSQMVRILDINEITTKLYNTKDKNELITNLGSIFIKDSLPAFIEQLCTITQNKTRFNGESINKTLDGRLINVALKWNVVPGYEKDYSRVLVSLIDITEQKKAEEEIKNSRKRLKIMNKILRHDLANDFVVIGSALRLYKSNSDTKMLNEIEKRVAKSLDTIKRLREQEAFIDSHSELNECDITEVLNDVTTDFPEVNIHIKGSGTAFADEALYSIFKNLINNAVKHGNSKKIDVSISTNNQFCEIRFKDFGTGIPDEIKDKVFDEGFVHGKKGNTGIGLYIVKQTIEGYGGNITVEDNKPEGAVFLIKLRKVM